MGFIGLLAKAGMKSVKAVSRAGAEAGQSVEKAAATMAKGGGKAPGIWQTAAAKGLASAAPIAVGVGAVGVGTCKAWEKLGSTAENIKNNGGLLGSSSDILVGRENADKAGRIAKRMLGKLDEATQDNPNQNAAPSQVPPAYPVVDSAGQVIDPGMSDAQLIGNAMGGQGGASNYLGMFGDFFNNLFSGKVSLGNTLALMVGAWLLMGRFGWLGRIGGGLMTYTMMNRNSQPQATRQPIVSQQPQQQIPRETEPYLGAGQVSYGR